MKNWATTWQNQQKECAPSEDSDQPGHPPSLIRVFAVCMKKAWVFRYPLSAQQRLWSDWADAQADLSLRWAHTHFVGIDMSWLKYQNIHMTYFGKQQFFCVSKSGSFGLCSGPCSSPADRGDNLLQVTWHSTSCYSSTPLTILPELIYDAFLDFLPFLGSVFLIKSRWATLYEKVSSNLFWVNI